MFVTLLIISKTLKGDNLVADKLCDLFSSSSCNDILLSPTAKIFGRYGLGEIGFAYFLTSTFFVLLSSKEHLQYLGGITLGTIVFPIWSVWYQKYKAKSWCVLCLLVIGVIVLQIVSSIIHLQWSLIKLPRLLLQGSLWGAVFVTFILVVVHTTSKVAWVNRLIAQSRNLVQLKYHPLVWKSLFDAEREVDCDLFTSKICFGDPKAKYQVTLLSNPYCGPCARIHHKIAQLIEAGARVQYVLCAFSDEWSVINKLLIATYLQEGEEYAWATFEDWYLGDTSRGRSCFKENLDDTTPEVIEEYAKHQRWQKSAGITTTPTLLLNGRFLPEVYTVDDILFVVQNKL